MIIKFTAQEIKKCQEFANSMDTGFYATRNQFNKEKRVLDQIVGKVGELAAFSYFKEKGINTTEPDFAIYGKSKKSWDFDLKGKDINLHVKTQAKSQGERYGVSWVFEKTDRHVFRDVSDNDYVCFVSVDLDNKCAEIKSVVALKELHQRELFKPMKLAYLTSKSAIYFDDLKGSLKEKLFVK
jgi:hypothetical protein